MIKTDRTFNGYFLVITALAGLLLLAACRPQLPVKQPVKQKVPTTKSFEKTEEYDYRESTLFFDKRKALLSMRVAVRKADNSLARVYQFQFRSRRDKPVKIGNIAINVAGRRIVLETGVFYLPRNKSLVFSLSAIDSQFVHSQSQAVFLFEYEGDTKIALIKKGELIEFINH